MSFVTGQQNCGRMLVGHKTSARNRYGDTYEVSWTDIDDSDTLIVQSIPSLPGQQRTGWTNTKEHTQQRWTDRPCPPFYVNFRSFQNCWVWKK